MNAEYAEVVRRAEAAEQDVEKLRAAMDAVHGAHRREVEQLGELSSKLLRRDEVAQATAAALCISGSELQIVKLLQGQELRRVRIFCPVKPLAQAAKRDCITCVGGGRRSPARSSAGAASRPAAIGGAAVRTGRGRRRW